MREVKHGHRVEESFFYDQPSSKISRKSGIFGPFSAHLAISGLLRIEKWEKRYKNLFFGKTTPFIFFPIRTYFPYGRPYNLTPLPGPMRVPMYSFMRGVIRQMTDLISFLLLIRSFFTLSFSLSHSLINSNTKRVRTNYVALDLGMVRNVTVMSFCEWPKKGRSLEWPHRSSVSTEQVILSINLYMF